MKTMNQNMLWMAALLTGSLLMSACSSDDDPIASAESAAQAQTLTFSVTDAGRVDAIDTRATTTDYATTFVSGDQISLYVLNSSGSVIDGYSNICLTYDGSSWTAEDAITYDATTLADATYCAIYPYSSSGYTLDASSTDHFATVVSGWSVAGDQSGDNYTKYDLMTGSTATTTADGSDYAISFTMTHRMALAVLNLPTVTYSFTNTDVTLSDYSIASSLTSVSLKLGSNTASTITPYTDGTAYRVLINPSTAYTLSGEFSYGGTAYTYEFTDSSGLTAATYYKHTVSVGSSSSGSTSIKLEVGDYYMADGTIVKQSAITSSQYEDVIGVVFYIGTTSGITADYSSCTHALVYATKRVTSTDATSTYFSTSDTYAASMHTGSKAVSGDDRKQQAISEIRGYEDTQIIMSLGEAETGFVPAYTILSNEEAPSMTSGWYMPSVAEFAAINTNSSTLNISLNAIGAEECFKVSTDGGDTYKFWTSTMRSNSYSFIYDASFDSSNSTYYPSPKGSYHYYRLALAF